MEGGARRVAGLGRRAIAHLERPRQVGRLAEQLLVEPVAPPSDRLRQRHGRRSAVEQRKDRHLAAPCRPHRRQGAGEQTAGDAEAALPDLDDPTGVVGERVPRCGDVVEAGADDAGDHAPHADGAGVVACACAPGFEPTAEQPHTGHHAEGDHQPIGMDRERADLERAVRGARDAGGPDHSPPRRRANSTVRAKISSRS